MLEQLLSAIRAGGTLEVGSLAARLGTSPKMVETMLEHLQRSGYIRPYQSCGEGCGGCNLKSECKSSRRVDTLRLWQG
jgi:DNA-binding IscR family transcriptional regulator